MAFDIGSFVSNLDQIDEVSKSNHFDVVFALPQTLIGGSVTTSMLALQCEGAELPGIDVTPIEYRHHAFTKRIPHHLIYQPLNLTFICGGALLEKQFFDLWIKLCVPNNTGLVQYRQDAQGNPMYEALITINQYDQIGNRTYFAQAQEAFPISLSQMNVNWSDDSIHRLNVTFVFTKWLTQQDGAIGQSTPVSQGGLLSINNFTNDISSLVRGIQSVVNGSPLQQLQGITSVAATSENIFGQVESLL